MNTGSLDLKSVGPRIRMMMPLLTPLEAKVVDTVFGLRDFNEETTLKEIAGEAGVSEAMVVKITKKLGFRRLPRVPQRRRPLQPASHLGDASGAVAGRHLRGDHPEGVPHLDPRACRKRWPSSTSPPLTAPPISSTGRASATSTAWAARRRSPAMSRTSFLRIGIRDRGRRERR